MKKGYEIYRLAVPYILISEGNKVKNLFTIFTLGRAIDYGRNSR